MPARTAAPSRPRTSPRATTASALWTLKRPASCRVERRRAAGPLDVGAETVGVLGDADRANVRRGLRAVGHDAGAGVTSRPDEGAGGRVVDVDDGRRSDRTRLAHEPRVSQAIEQRQLGVAVRLPRAVQLEMLVGEVREDRDVVGDARDAIEGEPVRGRLDDGEVVAGVDHGPQRRLELGRLGGRGVRLVGVRPAADPRRDGADHPGPPTRGLERRDRQVGGRRLAVRARDPDDRELMRGIAVPPRRGAGEGRPRRVHDDLRGGHVGEWPLHDHGGRTTVRRGGREVVAVGVLAGHGHEQRAVRHGPRIVGHRGDRRRPRARRYRRPGRRAASRAGGPRR